MGFRFALCDLFCLASFFIKLESGCKDLIGTRKQRCERWKKENTIEIDAEREKKTGGMVAARRNRLR